MVDLALLGCGGGMPMPERFLSSVLISYKGRKILMDCGEGSQVSMRLLGWGFKTIDIICITHGHGDHTVGLPGLLATIGNSGRTEPMYIIGPEGITDIVNGLRVIARYLPYEIIIIENPSFILRFGMGSKGMGIIECDAGMIDLEISTLTVDHSSPCISYSVYFKRKAKFDVGKATANQVPKPLWSKLQKGSDAEYDGNWYTPNLVLGDERRGIKISLVTDTRPVDEIPDFIRGSDLFICEGNYGDDNDLDKAIKNKHMTFREAAMLASTGTVRELLLTHFSPTMQEPEIYKNNAIDLFSNTIIGQDRWIKTFNFEDD